MTIIGEKLNSSIPSALALLSSGEVGGISALCKKQEESGAAFLDINTAMCENELEAMKLASKIACDSTECGIMLDSADVVVVASALEELDGRDVILNSITLDERHELIALAAEKGAGIVALPITANGLPADAAEEIENSERLIAILTEAGISTDKIYLDVVIETVAVNGEAFVRAFETTVYLRKKYPEIHIACGLSNVSFGLPARVNINTAAIAALVCAGLDSPIIDITNEKIRNAVLSARVLSGEDEYCLDYISANS